jgi:low affinity Fe/Cu permease
MLINPKRSPSWYSSFAKETAHFCGRPRVFVMAVAVAVILIWLVTGPLFGYSDTWQLVINTGTTIITFLMVFLIQNTQNRDTQAIQVKLDELIRATAGAHNALLDLEELEKETLEAFRVRYQALARLTRTKISSGQEHSTFKRLFSADFLGSRGLIHQIEALERRPRWCAPVMIASEVAAFAVHGVPSGTVYRQAP